ncbi:MAG: hypothetical protein HQL91_00365 [Magnetococcales bacterium]|nr:hypothetical protein [Magnetococcales bacterium]
MNSSQESAPVNQTLAEHRPAPPHVIQECDALKRRLALRTRELELARHDLQQFAYAASHDLQEPLRLVSGYVQLLQNRYRGTLDDKADGYIDYITGGVHQMQTMLHGLMELSRVETRNAPFVLTRLDDALDHALNHLQTELRLSGAQIIRNALPEVVADVAQLALLFRHLISNAIRFKSAEPPEIRLWANREEIGWVVSVSDNGIGIPAKFAERVFVVFQKLHPRTEYPGIGMGLPLCKRIVERHGGRIWVEPRQEPGALVRFALPDAPAEEEPS